MVAALVGAPFAAAGHGDHPPEPNGKVDLKSYVVGTDGVADQLGDQGPAAVQCRPFGDGNGGIFGLIFRTVPECVGGARYDLSDDLENTECDGTRCESWPGAEFGVLINDARRQIHEDLEDDLGHQAADQVKSDVAGTVWVLDAAGLILAEHKFCKSTGELPLPAGADEIVVAVNGPESLPANLDTSDPHAAPGCTYGTEGKIALSIDIE